MALGFLFIAVRSAVAVKKTNPDTPAGRLFVFPREFQSPPGRYVGTPEIPIEKLPPPVFI